jgi:zinc protease
MTGKNISVGGGAGGDTMVIRVTGSPKDLEVGLQLAHILLTDGKIEESAFNVWKQRTLQRLNMMIKMPQYRAFEAMLDLTSGGDPKRMLITPERIEAQTLSAGQAWFTRLCREAPIEVAVVGDLPLEQAMPLIERYIGSLPKRSRTAEKLDPLRKTNRAPGPLEKSLAIVTMTPQGMVLNGFIGCQASDVADRRALELAREILTSRLIKRIREEAAIVYSIRAQNQAAEVYEDSGMFTTGAPCDPGNTTRVHEEVDKLFAAFKESGPTEDELSNARKQVANDLDTETKEPTFWLGVLQDIDLHKRDLNEYKNMVEAFNAISADQIKTVFAKYYKPERVVRVSVTPKGGAEAPKADEAAKQKTPEPAGAGS